MTSYLHRLRKQEIINLSSKAGLNQDENTLKDDLVEALDKHLSENASRLSDDPAFEHYYSTRRTPFPSRSTGVSDGAASDAKIAVKPKARRVTKTVKEELEEVERQVSPTIQTIVTQPVAAVTAALTPVSVRRRSELLPASPADVAEDMEIAAERISSSVSDYYARSGIPTGIENLRQLCSSVESVQATLLLVEIVSLFRYTLPLRYAFEIPALHLGIIDTSAISVQLPDLFNLLTGFFWSTTLLWSTTNLILPLTAAYFYNLSTRDVKRHGSRTTLWRHVYDPMVFSLTKALLAYAIYGRGSFVPLLVHRETRVNVDRAMLGGYPGVLIGCAIGILTSLYEAAQRK